MSVRCVTISSKKSSSGWVSVGVQSTRGLSWATNQRLQFSIGRWWIFPHLFRLKAWLTAKGSQSAAASCHHYRLIQHSRSVDPFSQTPIRPLPSAMSPVGWIILCVFFDLSFQWPNFIVNISLPSLLWCVHHTGGSFLPPPSTRLLTLHFF